MIGPGGRAPGHGPAAQLQKRSGLALQAQWLLSVWLLLPAGAAAHEFTITPVTVVLPGDGTFQADVGLDADALALGLALETDSEVVARGMRALPAEEFGGAVERARLAVRRDIRFYFDGVLTEFQVSFPHHGTSAASEADPPTVLGVVARLQGAVPSGTEEVVVQIAERYKEVSLQIVTAGRDEPFAALVEPGAASPACPLAGGSELGLAPGVFATYLKLGFTHIVPKGADHILFVLGLFLLSARWRPLLYQVTAFTVAHSVTLALSTQGILTLPGRFVETLIALSISWVAIENLATSTLKPWRVAVVFGFGLLHGLGFASVLGELGLPEGRFLAAVLAFNVGVELGQLSVVAAAYAVAGRFQNLEGYRRWVVLPGSIAIAATGMWWAMERALG